MRLSISFITTLNSSSNFPVGSSSYQLSSNVLPIKGHVTLHPIEIAMSGLSGLLSNLEYHAQEAVLLKGICGISLAY
jgi:hypothetical protein